MPACGRAGDTVASAPVAPGRGAMAPGQRAAGDGTLVANARQRTATGDAPPPLRRARACAGLKRVREVDGACDRESRSEHPGSGSGPRSRATLGRQACGLDLDADARLERR
jgi:hypothetical protein